MKLNAKIKLFLMLVVFLASFMLKNHNKTVDTIYGDTGYDGEYREALTRQVWA